MQLHYLSHFGVEEEVKCKYIIIFSRAGVKYTFSWIFKYKYTIFNQIQIGTFLFLYHSNSLSKRNQIQICIWPRPDIFSEQFNTRINPLAPARCSSNYLISVISKHMPQIKVHECFLWNGVNIGSGNGLVPSGQCWHRSMSQYGIARLHWVKCYTQHVKATHQLNCQTSNISCTKSQNLNVSRLVLQLPLPHPPKPVIKSRMKM